MSCKHANNSDLNVEMRITLPCIDTLCKRSLVTSVCDQKLRKMPGLLRRIYYATWGVKTQTRGRTFSLWTLMLMLRGGAVESAVRHGRARSRDTFSHSEKGTRRYANAQRHQEPLHWSITCPKRKKKYSRVLHTCRARAVYWHPNNSGHEVNALENLPVMTLACWTLATLGQAGRSSC